MKMQKSYWVTDGENINLSVPFVKVDKQRRIVSGFATLDNVDKHGDIVDTQASMNAFTRFRGNIREMHQPIAVGKVVSFRQEEFYDKLTKKTYSGVFVDVYVSKGAEDTWEKVLDGTLSGFSIGGSINKADTIQQHDDYEGTIRVIKDYDLVELSLVDNPANQLANVFSIQKADIGFKVTGMATEIKTLNVLYCEKDEIAVAIKDSSKSCSVCDSSMKNIGWVEEGSATKSADVALVVDSYINKNTVSEGGIEMADELNVQVEEPVVEEAVAEEAAVEEAVVEEVIEKSADEESADVIEAVEEASSDAEVEDDSNIEKMLDGIKAFITESIAKSQDTPSVEQILAEMESRISKSMEEMGGKHGEMMKSVEGLQTQVANLTKRMEAYESATAMKKSSDLEAESVESLRKESIWKGQFLNASDLKF